MQCLLCPTCSHNRTIFTVIAMLLLSCAIVTEQKCINRDMNCSRSNHFSRRLLKIDKIRKECVSGDQSYKGTMANDIYGNICCDICI